MASNTQTSFEGQKSSAEFSAGPSQVIGVPGGLRLRTLLLLRWTAIIGQLFAVMFVWFGLGYSLPLLSCLTVIGASALVNISLQLGAPQVQRLGDPQSRNYFLFDTLQLAALLYLTGGLTNPFALLFLVPVTVSASVLSTGSTFIVALVTVICIIVLAFMHQPLPWGGLGPVNLPTLYVVGIWTAMVLACTFAAFFTWRLAQESRRMGAALAALQQALAREQELAAIGGLAAAAAHELGTPLATISVVAKELKNDLPGDSPMTEDISLLLEQSDRCRTILADLGRERAAVYALDAYPLAGLIDEACSPFEGAGVRIERHYFENDVPIGPERTQGMKVRRQPELLYALRNIIDNAIGFANEAIRLTVNLDRTSVALIIQDDGPGFPHEILARLGDPYVSGRDGEGGMGLGTFISKTLLERTGGEVVFRNNETDGKIIGAEVAISWPRDIFIQDDIVEPGPEDTNGT